MERGESPKVDPLLLRRIRADLVLFNHILSGDSCFSASHVRNPFPHSFRNMKSNISLSVPKTCFRAKFFIVNYSLSWSKLPQHFRNLSKSCIAFKWEVCRVGTAAVLVSLYHTYSPEDRLRETESAFWKMYWGHRFVHRWKKVNLLTHNTAWKTETKTKSWWFFLTPRRYLFVRFRNFRIPIPCTTIVLSAAS